MTYLLRGVWAGCFGVSSPAYIFRADLHHVMEPDGQSLATSLFITSALNQADWGEFEAGKPVQIVGGRKAVQKVWGAKVGTESWA